MKKIVSVLCCAVLLLAGCDDSPEETVSVQPVSMVCSGGAAGYVQRCAGKVVSGQTAKVARDSKMTVRDVYVQVGDMVEEGSALFAYDADAIKLELDKLRLELEGLANTVTAAAEEISALEQQRAAVPLAKQLTYTLQIEAKQADIREAEYKKALKEREIAAMEKSMEATEVTSPIAGRVMSINSEAGAGSGEYGGGEYGGEGENAYITVMDMTSYRIEGQINELNLYSLTVGMPVIIRSRTDRDVVWHGTVESIDWENPVSSNDGNGVYYYSGGSDEMTASSKYPFYVTLEELEGLVLGQHVYVEPDYGQTGEQEGLLLPEYYVCDADSAPYVWAANTREKLEKRPVVLGEYNAELGCWQVVSGLELSDYIAFPTETLSAGQSVSLYGQETASDGNAEGEIMPAMAEEIPAADGETGSFDDAEAYASDDAEAYVSGDAEG